MAAFSRHFKIRKANKKIYEALKNRTTKIDGKSPSEFLGMSKKEFQKWCDTEIPPERFIK